MSGGDGRAMPSLDVRLRTLRGEKTGWDYRFAVPDTTHAQWTEADWLRHIGDANWFKVPA